MARNQGSARHPLGLTNIDHISRYNVLSSKLIVATCYFDKGFLTSLGLMDDIFWVFARGIWVNFWKLGMVRIENSFFNF